ncbi:MAG: hypothetical protein AABY46_01250 [Nitrospirota bacterium]
MRSFLRAGVLALLVALPASYGIYNIFRPEQYPIKFLRGDVIQVNDTLLFGPYPTEQEIKRLKRQGVTELISLMDSSMPFESPLIGMGKRLAEENDLSFKNVSLSYLPNLKSKSNLSRVNELVLYLRENSHKKKYVHCYLGRHRTTLVKEQYLQAIHEDQKDHN